MRPPPGQVALLIIFTVSVAARPSWSSTNRPICELKLVERDKVASARCIACHDGSVAQAAPFSMASLGHLGDANIGSSAGAHPIDVDYQQSLLQNTGRLAPLSQLNPILVLSNGKITCATCHNGESLHPFRTAVSMEGSALCFACHAGY